MLEGSMTALITPFKNNKLDEFNYESLIKRQIKNGINIVVPVGTTGESATLSHEEHRRCIEIAVQTCKNTNVRVMAGAGSNSTKEAISLAKFAQKQGADGVLSITPYYNKPSQEGLYEHFKTIANGIDIPLTLYNVPSRTGIELENDTIIRLCDNVNNIKNIKEASGSLQKVVELFSKRPDIGIISGEDTLNYSILACGGTGFISVSSNLVPDKLSKLFNFMSNKDFIKARELNDDLVELNKVLFLQSNPIPVKAAMYILGLLDSLEYRLPLLKPSKEIMDSLELVLKNYDIVGV